MDRAGFDPLERFAEIERLAAKIYFRFSHLFFGHSELRDFWWKMGMEEEQHSAILLACKEMIKNYGDEKVDPSVTREKAEGLREELTAYLTRGTPSLGVEEAFKIALEIETSEIDAIYSKLVQLGGPKIAQTMQNLGVPASVQRQKLKAVLRRFCSDPALLTAAERL
jgi:phosphopantetheine adenylyltransferase